MLTQSATEFFVHAEDSISKYQEIETVLDSKNSGKLFRAFSFLSSIFLDVTFKGHLISIPSICLIVIRAKQLRNDVTQMIRRTKMMSSYVRYACVIVLEFGLLIIYHIYGYR